MSDMPGLALTMTAQALVLGGLGPRRLLLGALVGGVATGIRVQAAVLVMPVLLVALGEERRQGVWSTSLRALVAFGLGCLLWAIPLVIATGGIDDIPHHIGIELRHRPHSISEGPVEWSSRHKVFNLHHFVRRCR